MVTDRSVSTPAMPATILDRAVDTLDALVAATALVVLGWLYACVVAPLGRLTTAARRLAGGRYERPVVPRRYDPIGLLARDPRRLGAGWLTAGGGDEPLSGAGRRAGRPADRRRAGAPPSKPTPAEHPIRVLVNGIRGKRFGDPTVRGALRGGTLRVVAKTTGTAARFIHADGTEEPVHRKFELANIAEQIDIVRRAAADARTPW